MTWEGEFEIYQKALNQYLDGKEDVFFRFYLISNGLQPEILSTATLPHQRRLLRVRDADKYML